jgi:hypothetical protein
MVDFSKASDTIDHVLIVKKFNCQLLPGSIKNRIFSFLTGRSQMVKSMVFVL